MAQRRIRGFLLAPALLLALAFALPAQAAGWLDHGDHSGWTEFPSYGGHISISSGNYYLKDVPSSSTNVTITGNVTLCLNGQDCRGNLSHILAVIVDSGAKLTLCNCRGSSNVGRVTHVDVEQDSRLALGGYLDMEVIQFYATPDAASGSISATAGEGADAHFEGKMIIRNMYNQQWKAGDVAVTDVTDANKDAFVMQDWVLEDSALSLCVQGGDLKVLYKLTGSVTVTGGAPLVCGGTLTAAFSGNTGEENITWQWYRSSDGSVWDAIADAAGSTYELKDEDVGKQLKAVAAGAGDYGDTVESAPTAVVSKGEQTAPGPNEGYTINYIAETITAANGEIYEISTTNGADVTPVPGGSLTSYLDSGGTTLYIRKKETDSRNASPWTAIVIPPRPAAPGGFTVTPETVKGNNNGTITGTNTRMQYRAQGSGSWQTCADPLTGLAPGSYEVRYRATESQFASTAAVLTVGEGVAPIYGLRVEDITFDTVTTGYAQPAARTVTITNTGNTATNINKVYLTQDVEAFTLIAGSEGVLRPGLPNTTYSVQPAAGLAAGTYTVYIMVDYQNGPDSWNIGTAAATVSFTVDPAPPAGGGTGGGAGGGTGSTGSTGGSGDQTTPSDSPESESAPANTASGPTNTGGTAGAVPETGDAAQPLV